MERPVRSIHTQRRPQMFISDFSDEAISAELQKRMHHARSFDTFNHLRTIDPDAYDAVQMIAREICRQRDPDFGEGWTVEHDDQHVKGEMAAAASCYAANACLQIIGETPYAKGQPPSAWMWGPEWWKPKNINLDLIRAGALIAAEWGRWKRANIAAYVAGKDDAPNSPSQTSQQGEK